MKRKFFDFRLYIDMLRQLRLMGIIFGALCILASIAPVFLALQTGRGASIMPTIALTAPALLVFMFVGGVAFVLSAFSFLNKRSGSDFYHSLPFTRTCTYSSILAAILTWLYGIIVSTILLTWLTYTASGLPFDHSYIPWLLAGYLASTTFIAGAALIAVSLTGTLFSNIVLTVLIVFLPRFILFLFYDVSMNVARIAGTHELGLFFDPLSNMPVAFVFHQFMGTGSTMSSIFLSAWSAAYTAGVGIVYLVLGGLLFRFRKSEAAGRSAPNHVLQHVYRCAITLPFVIVLVNRFWGYDYMLGYLSSDAGTIIIFVISLAVYFLFEIITTRKAKKLLTAAPWYAAVMAVALVITLGARGMGLMVLDTVPTADQIKYVNIGVNEYGGYDKNTYAEMLARNIDYTEPEIRQIISDGLRYTVQQVVQGGNYYDGNFYSSHRVEDYRLALTDGRILFRQIYLQSKDYDRLLSYRDKNSEYHSLDRKMPSDAQIAVFDTHGSISSSAAKRVWDIFRQEAQALPDVQYSLVTESGNASFDYSGLSPAALGYRLPGKPPVLDVMVVQGRAGADEFTSGYFIGALTPKAADTYMDALFQDESVQMQDKLGYILDGAYVPTGYTWNVTLYNIGDINSQYPSGFQFRYTHTLGVTEDKTRSGVSSQVLHLLRDPGLKPGRIDKPMAVISMSVPGYQQQAFYVELTPEQVRGILDIAGPYDSFTH